MYYSTVLALTRFYSNPAALCTCRLLRICTATQQLGRQVCRLRTIQTASLARLCSSLVRQDREDPLLLCSSLQTQHCRGMQVHSAGPVGAWNEQGAGGTCIACIIRYVQVLSSRSGHASVNMTQDITLWMCVRILPACGKRCFTRVTMSAATRHDHNHDFRLD